MFCYRGLAKAESPRLWQSKEDECLCCNKQCSFLSIVQKCWIRIIFCSYVMWGSYNVKPSYVSIKTCNRIRTMPQILSFFSYIQTKTGEHTVLICQSIPLWSKQYFIKCKKGIKNFKQKKERKSNTIDYFIVPFYCRPSLLTSSMSITAS